MLTDVLENTDSLLFRKDFFYYGFTTQAQISASRNLLATSIVVSLWCDTRRQRIDCLVHSVNIRNSRQMSYELFLCSAIREHCISTLRLVHSFSIFQMLQGGIGCQVLRTFSTACLCRVFLRVDYFVAKTHRWSQRIVKSIRRAISISLWGNREFSFVTNNTFRWNSLVMNRSEMWCLWFTL